MMAHTGTCSQIGSRLSGFTPRLIVGVRDQSADSPEAVEYTGSLVEEVQLH